MSEIANTKKYEFKAEIKKLLDILVHSLYTSREIFLRELISNSSDALDKLRFESNRGTEIAGKDLLLEINVDFDSEKKMLTISDTGIGMTHDEVITNIGTIAKSGTEEFVKMISETKIDANNIIGKFGIGFYSAFMVAKEIVIKTKSFKKDEPAVEWKSDGLGDYEICELNEKIERGTKIEIHLKDDAQEFAEKWKLESIIKKHSSFISFPIFLNKEKINTISAIWREPKSSITKEKYEEFYKFLSHDTDAPMDVIHKSVDAPIQFNALLFIPIKSFEFFWHDRENYGLDLYVRRVLIQHKNKDILPEYLSFVKGVVDSEDLPLNISRETLQENVVFNKISSSVTNNILSHLLDKAKNDAEWYKQFWSEHGKILKLGYTDFLNHEKILELLRFNSTNCQDKDELVPLADYVSRAKNEQKEIYYICGKTREAMMADPHMEIFKKKGLEVLFLPDPVDEFVVSSLRKYKDYDFKSADTIDLKKFDELPNVEEQEQKFEALTDEEAKHFSIMLAKIKSIIGDKVVDVKESKRLVESAACLISGDDVMSASMQKILKMANQNTESPQKILEINPNHKLTRNLLKVFKKDSNDEYIKNTAEQLFETAQLQDGNLDDTHALVKKINNLLEQSSDWYCTLKNI